MKLNDIQKADFFKGLEQVSEMMKPVNTEDLDLQGVENRIQQTIGILHLLENINMKEESFKKVIVMTLKSLYKRKRELLYGYKEENHFANELLACS